MSRKVNELEQSERLECVWERLSNRYLPLEESKWRYSRSATTDDPEQGWKLHITATILTANRILTRIGPMLHRRKVLFKAPRTLLELSIINSGFHSEFSQVGKFITVYPRDSEEARFLAAKLDQMVPPFSGPAVPYDIQLHRNSSIYYRYGAFSRLNIKHRNGTKSAAIRNGKGRLIPDLRGPGFAKPKWLDDPFTHLKVGKEDLPESNPLKTTILAYEAISQRGKGGVYRALDVSANPIRRCILKEGRKNGETDWDGRDGCWRVKHENQVLSSLSARSVPVPKIYTRFEVEQNYYLVMECVEGENLESLLSSKREIEMFEAIQFSLRLAKLLAQIHSAGWVWRDCKPRNIIVSKSGILVPVDFEGACRIDRDDPISWATPGYVPYGSSQRATPANSVAVDLYALGAVLHQLLSGRVPTFYPPQLPLRKSGRSIPFGVTNTISALLNPNPKLRPAASIVSEVLGRLNHERVN